MRKTLAIIPSLLAAATAFGQVLLFDDFDAYTTQGEVDAVWTANGTPLTLTVTNRATSGTNSVYQSTSAHQSWRQISPAAYTTNLYFSFMFYDGGTALGRTYGMIYGYNGSGAPPTTPNQILAIGKYNGSSTTKYSGRQFASGVGGSNAGWFALDAATSPDRTVGWHKAEIIGKPDGTLEWRIDGHVAKVITGVSNVRGNYAVMGSALSSTTAMWFDDVVVESLLAIPEITRHPESQSVGAGSNAVFTVEAGLIDTNTFAQNGLTYQWQYAGTNITGATGSSYTRVGVQAAHEGEYSVVVMDAYGRNPTVSLAAYLTVLPSAPVIMTHPQDTTANAGTSVVFTVVSAGSAPVAYQWRHAGTNITGATASSYTRANIQQATAGAYSVFVSNALGTALSDGAILTVVDGLPVITIQPTNQTVAAGSNVVFRVTTTGSDPRSFQWRFNGANLSGATASSYTRNNAQTAQAGDYDVVITNAFGAVTSSVALLTVTNTAPIITTQPTANRTVPAGSNVVFSVSTWGTDPRSWQWHFNGSPIPGATASSYTRSNAQTNHSGVYQVIVTNTLGAVTSAVANLTVTNTAAIITTQPASRTVNAGSNVTFTVVAAFGTDPRTYQWRFNGEDISGATGTSYVLNDAQSSNAGPYSVVVSNPIGLTPSTNAVLTVVDIAPVITAQPQGRTVDQGGSVSFTVTATGTKPFSYRWLHNGEVVGGAEISSLNLTNVQPASAGNYTVEVINSMGTTASLPAALTVNATAPTPPVIQSGIAGAGTANAVISWSAVNGVTYQVQYKTNIAQSGWLILGGVTATGSVASMSDTSGPHPERFYRVIIP